MKQRIGFLINHPIQYYTPIFRELAKRCDLTVFFAHKQDAAQQARAGCMASPSTGMSTSCPATRASSSEERGARALDADFRRLQHAEIADRISAGRFDAFVVPGWSSPFLLAGGEGMPARACRSWCGAIRSSRGARRGAVGRVKGVVFPHMLKQFDARLYVGQRNREYLEHYGVPADRLFFSPHCVDNDAFRRASDAARAGGGARAG